MKRNSASSQLTEDFNSVSLKADIVFFESGQPVTVAADIDGICRKGASIVLEADFSIGQQVGVHLVNCGPELYRLLGMKVNNTRMQGNLSVMSEIVSTESISSDNSIQRFVVRFIGQFRITQSQGRDEA